MLDRTDQNTSRKATLYRMEMPSHTCPYGLKARDLLRRSGYEVDDRHLLQHLHLGSRRGGLGLLSLEAIDELEELLAAAGGVG